MQSSTIFPTSRSLNLHITAVVVFAMTVILAPRVQGQTETVLYNFTGGSDGGEPQSLTRGPSGNLYGTTRDTIFEMSPASGGGWNFTTLHTFSASADGSFPNGGLIFDAAGNIYGTTYEGGSGVGCDRMGCGVVFELSPTASGWVETVLNNFTGDSNGGQPNGGLAFDAAGNLYGTTSIGGDFSCSQGSGIGCGTVFKLSPGPNGWTGKVLYAFTGQSDGAIPTAGLVIDSAGSIYGTATVGGDLTCNYGVPGCGVVFRLRRASSGVWKETVLHTFSGTNDGAIPQVGLTFDKAGNLYGTTGYGGIHQSGVVFKLTPTSTGGWNGSVIHYFNLRDGVTAQGLSLDAAGNLFGAAVHGGSESPICEPLGCGVIFELSPKVGGGWNLTVLHTFTGSTDGSLPDGVALDGAGNLYGTIVLGGTNGWGAVFQISY